MTVEIRHGYRVVVVEYKNMYQLEAHYMHGDMNGSSVVNSSYMRDDVASLNFDLEGLAFMKTLTPGKYGTTTEEAKEKVAEFFAANNNFHWEEEDVEGFIEEFVVEDDTDDSYEHAATLQNVYVFLYDENGDKYSMNVKVNGKPIND